MSLTKNFATVAVGALFVLVASFALVTPAKADMLSDLQTQLNAILAQIAALQGTQSSGTCVPFNTNLSQGTSGPEVMRVQKFLNSHGAQVAASGAGSVGNETMSYGPLTTAAVAKFQAANGITPAAGYWGPITRAKANSLCVPTTTTPPVVTPPAPVLNGGAGTLSITETSADVETEVRTGTTEKVVGFRAEASGSDVRVTSVRVKLSEDNSSDSTESKLLTAYASRVSLYADGVKVGEVDASSFTRDSSGVYSSNIPVDTIVRMGAGNRVIFHVGFTAVGSIDSDDLVAEWDIDVTQVRYTDAAGAVLSENPAVDNTGITVERLSGSGEVELRMTENSANPKAGSVKVDDSGTTEVVLAVFNLKAVGSDLTFDRLKATTTSSGADIDDIAQVFYLYRGSTRIAEVDAASGVSQTLVFDIDGDEESINEGSTVTYKIVAKVNKVPTGAFNDGDKLEVDVSVDDVNARAEDGKSLDNDDKNGSVTTYAQELRENGISVTSVSTSVTSNDTDNPVNSSSDFRVRLKVVAFGEDVYIPLNAFRAPGNTTGGVKYSVLDGSNAVIYPAGADNETLSKVSGGGVEVGNNLLKLQDGEEVTLEFQVNYNPTSSGNYRVQIESVNYRLDAAAPYTATMVSSTVPVEDFRTSFDFIQN